MDEKLIKVKLLNWMTYPSGGNPALPLHAEETNRIIPIWIDLTTATEYSARGASATQRRPGMHKVFADSLDMVGRSVLRGQITNVHEDVFIASLVLEGGAEMDMRPSDLIFVARELEILLYAARGMLDATSIAARLATTNGGSLADESETDSIEALVSEFTEFLSSIDANYFVEPHGDMEGKRSDGKADGGTDSTSDGDR